MRISNYPTDTLTGAELILATDVNTSTQEYKTVNFSVDTLKTFLTTDANNGVTSIVFEGAAEDAYEGTLTSIAAGASKTYTLPNVTGTVAILAAASNTAITSTPEELNLLDNVSGLVQADFTKLAAVNSTADELNLLDGVTATTTELNYVDGVTSNIQTQLDTKLVASNLNNYLDKTATASQNLQGQYLINGFPLHLTAAPVSSAAGDLVLRHNVDSSGSVVKVIAWKNDKTEGTSDDGIAKIYTLTSATGTNGNWGGRLRFQTRQKASANYNTMDLDSNGLLTVPNGLTITTGNITLGSTAITAVGEELNILDASAGNTAVASDMATNSGAITSNNYKIKHTLTLNGALADDAELADIDVTNNKVLDTSVVLANSSVPCQVDVHTVVNGSFKVRVKNISGASLADDSTMVINYRVI